MFRIYVHPDRADALVAELARSVQFVARFDAVTSTSGDLYDENPNALRPCVVVDFHVQSGTLFGLRKARREQIRDAVAITRRHDASLVRLGSSLVSSAPQHD